MTPPLRDRVAVVGGGVAGLVALYESDTRLGGHADTHDVETG